MISPSSTIIVPSLVLLPLSAQVFHHMAGLFGIKNLDALIFFRGHSVKETYSFSNTKLEENCELPGIEIACVQSVSVEISRTFEGLFTFHPFRFSQKSPQFPRASKAKK